MKSSRKVLFILLSCLFLLSVRSFGQTAVQKDSVDTKIRNAAREIMSTAGTCALITLDEKNIPMVRTMDPFPPENEFTVWFGTNPKSRKVEQIKNNPTVTLYYLDKGNAGYVVLHGVAQLVDDQNEKEKHWKKAWENFYTNKAEDYLLIKVSPQWMEVINFAQGIKGNHITWEAPIVYFNQ